MQKTTCCAVIVAAGGSTRMGRNKQLLPLLGVPALARTLWAFEQAECVGWIVLVCRSADRTALADLAQISGVTKLAAVVSGGDTRQRSVAAGVKAAPAEASFLAIHDGARPLVTPGLINAVIRDAALYGASAPAVPVKDTIKEADDRGFILATPDRSRLRAVQTPQVFQKEAYLDALRRAAKDFTDDCQLFESLGLPVHLCEGSYDNFKLTTAGDIPAAEAVLRSREKEVLE